MLQIDSTTSFYPRKKKHILDLAYYFPRSYSTKYIEGKPAYQYSTLEPQYGWMKQDFEKATSIALPEPAQLRQTLAYGLAVVAMFLFNKHLIPFGIAYGLGIATDSVNVGTSNTGGDLSWSHTCTGASLGMVVSYMSVNSVNPGVTYNSVSCTNTVSIQSGAGRTYAYTLINPATGSHSVAVGGTSGQRNGGQSISFTGADQTTLIGNTGTADANPCSISLTTTRANSYTVSAVGWYSGSNNPSADNGQSAYGSVQAQTNYRANSFYQAQTTIGAKTLSYSGGEFQQATVEVLEAITGPQNVKTVDGLAIASVKTFDGLATASIKTINGVA